MDVVRRWTARALATPAVLAVLSSAASTDAAPDTLFVQASAQQIPAAAVQPAASAPRSSLQGLKFVPRADAPATNGAHWPWSGLIAEASRRFGIPEAWVRGVMRVESGGRATLGGRAITSSAGAMGLMQLMPATFADMTIRYSLGDDPYDPRANILAGAAFLRELYDRYGPAHFLAAYNAGPGRLDDHLRTGRPLPLETQRYVRRLAPLIDGASVGASARSPLRSVDPTRTGGGSRPTPPSSRPLSTGSARPRLAPLFAVVNHAFATIGGRAVEPPENTLFVHRSALNRRRGAGGSDAEN